MEWCEECLGRGTRHIGINGKVSHLGCGVCSGTGRCEHGS